MSENPVLVRLTRGRFIESEHRGSLVIVGHGRVTLAHGDPSRGVFLRSSAKPLQAAAAIKSFIDNNFHLTPVETALLCASHNGEDRHVQAVAALLARGGLSVADLRCATHVPLARHVTEDLARRGIRPTPLHHNCSGKHTGMLLFAKQLGAETHGYLEPSHPIQVRIRDLVRRVCECSPPGPEVETDGCSAPTFRLPLQGLALGFARIANPSSADPDLADVLTRVRDAMIAHPEMVAGEHRIDTDLMRVASGRVLSKVGAEGIIACGLPGLGIGIAIKIDDGNQRAYESLLPVILRRLGVLTETDLQALGRYADPVLRNHAGLDVGTVEIAI